VSPYRLLRAARVSAGLTEAEVAAELGVAVRTVQRWEAGATPSRSHSAAIADLVHRLEVPVPAILVPASLGPGLRSAYGETIELGAAMDRRGEVTPPGASWVRLELVSVLRRAGTDSGRVFPEEIGGLIAEELFMADWRTERLGRDIYADYRWRIITILNRLRDGGRVA